MAARRTLSRLAGKGRVFFYRKTGGRIGGKVLGKPVMLLNTVGRKSGEVRSVPVLYVRDGDRYLVAASYAGSDRNPDWFRNLVAHPEAEIEIGRLVIETKGRVAEGSERDELYRRIVDEMPKFAGYAEKTERAIPVVVLEPIAVAPGADHVPDRL
jgi:deazaflavin-dependent oxidoreductase (nitroreductase family)